VGYVQVAELCAGGAVSERTVRAAPSVEALDVAVLPGAAPLDVGGLGTDNRRRAKRSVSALLTILLSSICQGRPQFDKEYHVEGSRLHRFAWFRRKQELHFVHHRHANSNFAVIHFFWDRILGTCRRPDAGQTQTNGTLRMGCAFSKLHPSEESLVISDPEAPGIIKFS
jgi:hypothetical protein